MKTTSHFMYECFHCGIRRKINIAPNQNQTHPVLRYVDDTYMVRINSKSKLKKSMNEYTYFDFPFCEMVKIKFNKTMSRILSCFLILYLKQENVILQYFSLFSNKTF